MNCTICSKCGQRFHLAGNIWTAVFCEHHRYMFDLWVIKQPLYHELIALEDKFYITSETATPEVLIALAKEIREKQQQFRLIIIEAINSGFESQPS
jgi:hypothetical protein